MKFTIPFSPVSAARPNWSNKNGRATRAYMPKKYAEYRRQVGAWFENWLKETDYQLVKELYRLPNGELVKDPDTGKLNLNFLGYDLNIIFYVPTANYDIRPFPLTAQSSDLDNYYKGVTDAIFESDSVKNVASLNDRWIQRSTMLKVACKKGEGKTVVDLKQLQL